MEETMSYIFKPTLQHMSMAKIAISWWIQIDVSVLTPKPYPRIHEFKDEMDVLIKMRENVRNLHLPEQLKSQLLTFIKPIGTQIVQWYKYLRYEFHVEPRNPRELRWTSKGTIDIKESVLVLVQDQSLDILKRYELACSFCFTLEMHELRQKIGQEGLLGLVKDGHKQKLVVFWDYYLRKETNQLQKIIREDKKDDEVDNPDLSPAEYAFKCAVKSVNLTAMEYFYEHLTTEEKLSAIYFNAEEVPEQVFMHNITNDYYNTPPRHVYREMLCFFLPRMSQNQRVELLFEDRVESTLECFLYWPYHSFFLAYAEGLRLFIRERDFAGLLILIRQNLENNTCESRNEYREIFRDFWRSSRQQFKKYVLDAENDFVSDLLWPMFDAGERELCRTMLREADAGEKEKLIDDDSDNFEYVIRGENWDFLRFMLDECAPSARIVQKLKASMIRESKIAPSFDDHRIKEFLQILDIYLMEMVKNDVEMHA